VNIEHLVYSRLIFWEHITKNIENSLLKKSELIAIFFWGVVRVKCGGNRGTHRQSDRVECKCDLPGENSQKIYCILIWYRAFRLGWRRPIGCLKWQVIVRKRATNYRAFLRKWSVKIRHPMGLRHHRAFGNKQIYFLRSCTCEVWQQQRYTQAVRQSTNAMRFLKSLTRRKFYKNRFCTISWNLCTWI